MTTFISLTLCYSDEWYQVSLWNEILYGLLERIIQSCRIFWVILAIFFFMIVCGQEIKKFISSFIGLEN